ncbi:hypothetical protein ACF1BN_21405 [Streptomyces sp. NPDC014861]|uniref:hypothetical protein n=1 Tax=Streptomyces sp. NPDC014861 TaxID=3364923 RepID=UPI0036FE9609
MRIDEPARLLATRALIYAVILAASPVLLAVGAPIRRRYLRYVHRDDAPQIVGKENGSVSFHYGVVTNPLLHWLCRPTEFLIGLARRSRQAAS